MIKEAYFAGGCFWCVTPIYKMYGVDQVICGYAGGDEVNPTYEQVKHQETGHRETIKLVYDDEKVSYDKLLDIYFANVDPYDGEGQFIDKGFSYTVFTFHASFALPFIMAATRPTTLPSLRAIKGCASQNSSAALRFGLKEFLVSLIRSGTA